MELARLWRDARYRLQALRGFIGTCVHANVCSQGLDLPLRIDQLIGKQTQCLARRCWQTGLLTSHDQAFDIVNARLDQRPSGRRYQTHQDARA